MADPLLAQLREVLDRYGLSELPGGEPQRAGSGFSGAEVWRVETAVGPVCVRRWPGEHPSRAGLEGIHYLLRHAHASGCRFVPSPMTARDDRTFEEIRDRLWEVTPWMPGEVATYGPVSSARRTAILAALASFHRAMAKLRSAMIGHASAAPQLSPGLLDRSGRLERAMVQDINQLRYAAVPNGWQELAERRGEFCRYFAATAPKVRARVVAAQSQPAHSIPCIRDIRREHVLFTGDEVTGWVDFGALREEHPAADLARVLGEFFDDRPHEWDAIVAEYQQLVGEATVSPVSLAAVHAFDQSGILLGMLNWLRWVFLENRDFEDRAAVVARFDRLLEHLRRLAETT